MALALVGAGLGISAPALAQEAPPEPTESPSAPPPTPNDPKMAEAIQRYEAGVRYYEGGAYDAARIELERAYALAPSYKLLYNIGLVYGKLSNFVDGLRYLERYLAEGGGNVPPERRAAVEKLIADYKRRIAGLTVRTNVGGAEISVDDVPVGRSPLEGRVNVNPGRRKVSASKSGYLPATKVVDVASGESLSVELDLATMQAKTVYAERPTRRVPWLGWVATGTLAAGAGVFSYLSFSQSAKLEESKAVLNPDPAQLESEASTALAYSITADALGVAAVITGVTSLYLTIKWGQSDGGTKPPTERAVRIAPTPLGVRASGSF